VLHALCVFEAIPRLFRDGRLIARGLENTMGCVLEVMAGLHLAQSAPERVFNYRAAGE
jgi:hypothetical protein